MVARADNHGLKLRPHFKTHQSREVGRWFRELGITAITVSSVRMAEYFAEDGWSDITIAFPFNVLEHDALNNLPSDVQVNIILEDPDTIRAVGDILHRNVGVFITVDVGAGRTGIDTTDSVRIGKCVSRVQSGSMMEFKGFLTHAGHTYRARGAEEIRATHEEAMSKLTDIYATYCKGQNAIISYGDTPSCSVSDSWQNIDEIRPGNFVFYDLMQVQIGSCRLNNIAVAVACPVVALHPERSEIVLYGGAIHFGKDSIATDDGIVFGVVYTDEQQIGVLSRISQEHGVVRLNKNSGSDLKVGSIVSVYPVHSCMTAQYLGGYITLDGQHLDHLASSRLTPK